MKKLLNFGNDLNLQQLVGNLGKIKRNDSIPDLNSFKLSCLFSCKIKTWWDTTQNNRLNGAGENDIRKLFDKKKKKICLCL